ncbi:2-oxoglutarate dehydrogenase complex dihydrolipoyllysine-residue succinyltransferase [Persicobacter diffluens]|uniref:Dihydrolipoyllysine-residue succinyltransferase component of 2-oxoglutarate dehydrogenase complex n=1 Tax=Persicobacter diffluens TaxID=981 RepID=A0AAN4VUH2_9BACT|nr:dihydrolipoyllysine-residue succinyltransferase component of 2-oxoglutarate dehydrogenase complex [Persicobacter diffluens]
MSLKIKVPEVGESITEVTISQWLKADGELVEMDEVICEMESDKATFELTAEASGKLKIHAQEGETLEIGALVCEIDESAAGSSGQEDTASEAKTEATEAKTEAPSETSKDTEGAIIEMKVPTVGESITEVTIASWLKGTGDHVEMDEVIAEIESDKATFELTAETSGELEVIAEEGETLEIGALLCKITVGEGAPVTTNEQKKEAASPNPMPATATDGTTNYATGHASPAAAKILAEKGISADQVKGTGVNGRVTKEDAQKAKVPAAKPAPKPAAKSSPAPEKSSGVEGREQTRKKMTPLRKTISKRLVQVKNETAMLTTFNEVNMKPIMDLRKKYKDSFKQKYEVNLGFMSFFTKAVCLALQEFPAVNAQIDGEEMVYNDFCDISIAVSAPKGLVVPVIRNAEQMSFDTIEKTIVSLATKARDNKLSIDEMTGGTFTITNGGIFGSMLSTPIINAPQSAILGMHNIVERPMAVNGEVKILPIMYVALSYDHRIIDGRESVGFLVRVKELLEDPSRLLLGI